MEWEPKYLVLDAVLTIKDNLPDNFKTFFTPFNEDEENFDSDKKFEHFSELFLELIGCYTQGKIQCMHVIDLLSQFDFSKSKIEGSSLIASLWFWGTQVYIAIILLTSI